MRQVRKQQKRRQQQQQQQQQQQHHLQIQIFWGLGPFLLLEKSSNQYILVPGPSKGCHMVFSRVSSNHPLGFKHGTPWKIQVSIVPTSIRQEVFSSTPSSGRIWTHLMAHVPWALVTPKGGRRIEENMFLMGKLRGIMEAISKKKHIEIGYVKCFWRSNVFFLFFQDLLSYFWYHLKDDKHLCIPDPIKRRVSDRNKSQPKVTFNIVSDPWGWLYICLYMNGHFSRFSCIGKYFHPVLWFWMGNHLNWLLANKDRLEKATTDPEFVSHKPIGSMGLVYLPTFNHKNQPNVGKYTSRIIVLCMVYLPTNLS